MKQMKIGAITAAVLLLGAMAVGGIASTQANEPEAAASEAELAKAAFWDAFTGGSIDGVLAAREQLVAAAESAPDDGELPLLISGSYYFFVSEIGWLEPSIDPSEILSYNEIAYDYADLAVHIGVRANTSDSDPRTFQKWVGFFGGSKYFLGDLLGDDAMLQKGIDLMTAIIPDIPDFGHANLASNLSNALAYSADAATSHEAYFLFYEHCTGETLDRANPDVTPVLSIVYTAENPTCGNSPHAPHGLQGRLFNFADSLVKNGKPDAARPVYEIIPHSDGYDTWASVYHDLVNERLASDLHARAASYLSDDATLHPKPGLDCLGCHER